MKNLTNKKKMILSAVLLALVLTGAVLALIIGKAQKEAESLFNLSEREVLMEIDDSKKLELESDAIDVNGKGLVVSWISSNKSVATVKEDGTVVAIAGGESKITAIVEYKERQYSTSCMVTVKAGEHQYSTYKLRWFTQKQDRSDYEVVEETYERLVGSSVEMTEMDALKKLPNNYKLNKEKSRLAGEVQRKEGACVIEVYFDVAEVTYYVDYYYESDTQFGTYPTKETKKFTTYAFTEVKVTENPKKGFEINEAVAGTRMTNKSVVSGSRLKVFCDRVRSKVTVDYISEKPTATYECIYGVGLVNAPEDVFVDSAEYKIATFINGKKAQSPADLMKTITKDTTVKFQLDGVGFEYSIENGVSTIRNNSEEKATSSRVTLNGKSDTIYLSANYKTTGSSSNTFGISLSDGKTSRQIRLSKQGVTVMKNHTNESGLVSGKYNAYINAGVYNDGNVFVWAQNKTGTTGGTKIQSVVNSMLKDRAGSDYQICWAVVEGVLYCNVEGQTVLRLPLTYLDKTWTAKQQYRIGFTAYDASAWGDELEISQVKCVFGKDAKALLVTNKELNAKHSQNMGYDVFTGAYLPASKSGAAYIYGTETTENTGVSANVTWVDKDNTASAIGISLKLGEKSIQYVVQGQNQQVRSQTNHKWENVASSDVRKKFTNQIVAIEEPFNADGSSEVKAFVKDGYFYVLYNGVQVQCIDMLSLFPSYTAESKVSVGICSWDANLGLAKFTNVAELNADAVMAVENTKEWGFYSESFTENTCNFVDAAFTKTDAKARAVKLFGSSATWQIDGTMNRTDDKLLDLVMGFRISSVDGTNNILLTGRLNGFQSVLNGVWPSKNNNYQGREYDTKPSQYAFNTIVSDKFFNKDNSSVENAVNTRTQESMGFKAVIYNDVFYVWFTDESGNTGLCWRVPLTEAQFGGFEKGSNYIVELYMGGSDTRGSMTNLDVKMGYHVTEQQEFVKDNKNITYIFADAIQAIDKNVARWDASSFNHKTVAGNVAEELVTANTLGTGKVNSVYLAGSSKTVYLKTELDLLDGTHKNFDQTEFMGIIIKINDQERHVVFNDYGVSLYNTKAATNKSAEGIPAITENTTNINQHNYYGNKSFILAAAKTGYIFLGRIDTLANLNKSVVYNMIKKERTDTDIVEWAIVDDTLYGRVNGVVFLRMPLNKLFDGYDSFEMKDVKVGLVARNVPEEGDFNCKETEVYYGEEAIAKLALDKKLEAEPTNMYFEPFTGSYIPRSSVGSTGTYDKTITFSAMNGYLYGNNTDATQSLSTVIESVYKESIGALYGVSVKKGNKSGQVIVRPGDLQTFTLKNMSWGTNKNLGKVTNFFNGEGKCKLDAVVKEGVLYVFFNDELAVRANITELVEGYKLGDSVELGIYARDSYKGLVIFKDTSFASGQGTITDDALNATPKYKVE